VESDLAAATFKSKNSLNLMVERALNELKQRDSYRKADKSLLESFCLNLFHQLKASEFNFEVNMKDALKSKIFHDETINDTKVKEAKYDKQEKMVKRVIYLDENGSELNEHASKLKTELNEGNFKLTALKNFESIVQDLNKRLNIKNKKIIALQSQLQQCQNQSMYLDSLGKSYSELIIVKNQLEECNEKKLKMEQDFRKKMKQDQMKLFIMASSLNAMSNELFGIKKQMKKLHIVSDSEKSKLHSMLLMTSLRISEFEILAKAKTTFM